jgi:two-component system response regulator YesN
MIVDDEVLARNHIRSMIQWERYGYSVCGEASNGEEALQYIPELQPDIVIIDMKMKHMDGVELSKHIKERFNRVKMIVVSSYDEFEYVRDSMKNGVVDYLLKHCMNASDLLEVLDKARQQLLQDAKRLEEQELTNRKWEIASPILTQNVLKEMILGTAKVDERLHNEFRNMIFGGIKSQGVLLLIQIIHYEWLTAKYSDAELNIYHRSVIDLCIQAVGEPLSGCAAYMEKGRFVLFVSFGELRSENMVSQHVDMIVRKIEKSLKLFLNTSVICLKGAPIHALEEMKDSYQSLLRKLEGVFGNRSPEDMEAGDLSMTVGEEKRLLAALEMADTDGVLGVLDEIFSRLRQEDYGSKQRVVTELIQYAEKIGRKFGIETDWIFRQIFAMQQQNTDIDEMKIWIHQIYLRILEHSQQGQSAYSPYVEQAVRLIRTRYKQNISLEEAAHSIGITPSYLSRLFKEETGATFTEYLNTYRIEVSKRMIDNGEIRVKDIYNQVGFNNYSYFIQVFRKATGQTPYSYARAVRKKRSTK